MEENPRTKNDREAEHHFQFDRDFVRRKQSGIYVPEPEKCEHEREPRQNVVHIHSHLPVEVKRDRVAIGIAIITAFISTIGLYILFKYTQAAFNQVTETQTANSLAREGITNSWIIAERARQTAIDAERPWIGVMRFEPSSMSPNSRVIPIFTLVNSGRRPAQEKLAEIDWRWYKTFPTLPTYLRAETKPSTTIHVPNVPLGIATSSPIEFTQDGLANRIANGEQLYVYGHVEYIDVISKDLHHSTFCVYYIPKQAIFVACPFYNSAD